MKKILFFFVVLLTSVQMMAQDVTDGRRYFSFLERVNATSTVSIVASDRDFLEDLERDEVPMVFMFHAPWCGPCKVMYPYFRSLAEMFPSVAFFTVDIDVCTKTWEMFGEGGIPSFIMFKKGQKVGTVVGADREGLKSMIQENIY